LFTLGVFNKIIEAALIFGLLFSTVKNRQKMGWATLWAFFSQTHLVTLVKDQTKNIFVLQVSTYILAFFGCRGTKSEETNWSNKNLD
jgi:hypothetical protein